VLVNALTTDLDLNVLEEAETDVVDPATASECREVDLEVDAVDQITVAGDLSHDGAGEPSSTVEGVGDGLNRKIRVTTVDYLEEGNLRVTSSSGSCGFPQGWTIS
jgi:hypothetical protein